jgi:serpin B
MVYAGAHGQTEQQMADTLHFTLPQERLHPAFNALDLQLKGRSQVRSFELHIANAVWGQNGYSFLPEYLDVLAQNYGAGVRLVDFAQDGAVEAVNGWVKEETQGRISGILDSISPDAKLVLANAVYFNARWAKPFEEEETEQEAFYLLEGDEIEVPMMHQAESFQYTDGDGYQAIELPYSGWEVAMVILLPESGRFREIEDSLKGEWVEDVLGAFSEQKVVLSMPKFRFETPIIPLKRMLSAMGMPNAFSSAADFAGMDGSRKLNIDRVLHKAFIQVDEQRTEAAAVTTVDEVTVVETVEVEGVRYIVMKIDRPFVFLIRDIKTNTILFVGRVMNPASE